MANTLSQEELQRLARLGAASRLAELEREMAAIRAAFPDLGGQRRRGPGRPPRRRPGRPRKAESGSVAQTPAVVRKRRGRPRMSAAQRRAVSERMKKYWAERRKAKGK